MMTQGLGKFLAKRAETLAKEHNLEDRVDAIVARVEGLAARVEELERNEAPKQDDPQR